METRFFGFWILLFLCLENYVCGTDVRIPSNTDAKKYWQKKLSPIETSNHVPKRRDRKHFDISGTRRLFGRHVCSQSRVTMQPVKTVQSYCKPDYRSYLRRCDKDDSRYCTGYRVAYEISYRTVESMVARTESVNGCCPGWTQNRASAPNCKKAICSEDCQNGGSCIKPGLCSCLPGWTGKTCMTDIDECLRKKASCETRCVNTPGSYRCECEQGYQLQTDQQTCKSDNPVEVEKEDNELIKQMDLLQKRLEALEEWQLRLSNETGKEHVRHERDYRINSLSEQIALLEAKLEQYNMKFLHEGEERKKKLI